VFEPSKTPAQEGPPLTLAPKSPLAAMVASEPFTVAVSAVMVELVMRAGSLVEFVKTP
jgi:hypothetical protein